MALTATSQNVPVPRRYVDENISSSAKSRRKLYGEKRHRKDLQHCLAFFSPKMKLASHVILANPMCFSNCLDNWQRPATESVAKSSDPRESNQFPEKIMKISNKCNINFTEKKPIYFTNLPIIQLWVNYGILWVNYVLITVTEYYGYFSALWLCIGYGRLWVVTRLR